MLTPLWAPPLDLWPSSSESPGWWSAADAAADPEAAPLGLAAQCSGFRRCSWRSAGTVGRRRRAPAGGGRRAQCVTIGCRFALPLDWLPAERTWSQHHLAGIGQEGRWGGRRRNGAGWSLALLLVQLLLLLLGCRTLRRNRWREESSKEGGGEEKKIKLYYNWKKNSFHMFITDATPALNLLCYNSVICYWNPKQLIICQFNTVRKSKTHWPVKCIFIVCTHPSAITHKFTNALQPADTTYTRVHDVP